MSGAARAFEFGIAGGMNFDSNPQPRRAFGFMLLSSA
jgi:hypothetical protein